MTKNTFKILEKACKDSWRKLAKNGNNIKPNAMFKFINGCPACHTTYKRHSYGYENCSRCPVDVWRNIAIVKNFNSGACTHDGQLFGAWDECGQTRKRKRYAEMISELKWTWLPIYATYDIESIDE